MLSSSDQNIHHSIFKCGVDQETLQALAEKMVEAECVLILPAPKQQSFPTDESP